MDAPSDSEERRDPVSRPLSPSGLDSQSGAELPLSQYNQPHYPSPLYDVRSAIRATGHHFPPTQPFRRYNYLDASGEDLPSRQYTLESDYCWHYNRALTNAYRTAAQQASQNPHFTNTFVPSEHWNPHQVVATRWLGGTNRLPPAPISPAIRSEEQFRTPVPSSSRVTLEMLPPGPEAGSSSLSSGSLASPTTPVSPSRPKRKPRARRRDSTSIKSPGQARCEECNLSFMRGHELKRHMQTAKVHRGERQFSCKYCGSGFTRDDARVRHERMCEENPNKEEGSKEKKGKGKARKGDSDDVDE